MNSRDPERVVALYDSEAVLSGTASPTLRDTLGGIRDYFKPLAGFPTEFKAVVGELRVPETLTGPFPEILAGHPGL